MSEPLCLETEFKDVETAGVDSPNRRLFLQRSLPPPFMSPHPTTKRTQLQKTHTLNFKLAGRRRPPSFAHDYTNSFFSLHSTKS